MEEAGYFFGKTDGRVLFDKKRGVLKAVSCILVNLFIY